MPLTLVQLLAARGMAPVDLQAAEARRVKLGGGLETSLLELGVLEESKIGELWSEASRLPRPPPELLIEVSSANATLFPQQLAERYGMVPLGLVRRQLSLLVRHPVDLSTVDEISFLLSRPLKLYIGTELEIAELLGSVYGVAVPDRLRDLRQKLRPGNASPPLEIPRIQTPPEATFAPPAEESPGPIYDRASAVSAEAASPGQPSPEPTPEVAAEPAPETPWATAATAAASASEKPPEHEGETAPESPPGPPPDPPAETPPEPKVAAAPEPPPIVLPVKRSLSPEPWSINLPLVEPPSASRRSKAPLPAAPAPAPYTPHPGPLPQAGEGMERTAPHAARTGLERKVPPTPRAGGMELVVPPAPRAGEGMEWMSPPAVEPASAPASASETTVEPASAPAAETPAASASATPVETDSVPAAAAEPTVESASAPASAAEPSVGTASAPAAAAEPSVGTASAPASASEQPVEPASPPASETSETHVEATPLSSGYGGRAGPDPRLSASEALIALRQEETRDGVIGVAVDFLRGAFDFVAVFVRHEETFQVFEATGVDYGGGADLTQTIVDVERSKVLRTVVEGKAPYVGPIPSWDPLDGALGALGRGRLRAVLMYPIVIRDRTIAVIHGDRGGEALAPRQLSDVALVLSQLGAQLERVIRERRRQGARPRAAPTPQAAPNPAPPPIPAPAAPPEPAAPEVSSLATPEVAAAEPQAPEPTPAFPQPPPPPPPSVPPLSGPTFAMAPPLSPEDAPASAAAVSLEPEPTQEAEPFEVPIDWVELAEDGKMSDQVRAFLSGDPPARAQAAAVLRGGGEDAGWALAERFPGPLFVFRMTLEELPAPDAMGPVMGLLASLGAAALPALSDLAESTNEERRFWATVLIAKTGDNSAVPVLARRLLDASPDVALAARRGLWRLRKTPEFSVVLRQATEELVSADLERALPIIRALGQFHHVPAIPRLIQLLTARDSMVSQAANEALREVARQDFGTSERRWNAWWEQARGVPRIGWVIDALEDRDRDLRLSAISELTELTGFDLGYRSDLEPNKQGPALQRWRDWLEREGRSRATPLPFPAAS